MCMCVSLGASWLPSWGQNGPNWGQNGQRWPFCAPKWFQNQIKIDKKSIPKCTSILIPFFDRFLIDLRSQNGAPEPPKWCFRFRNCDFRSKTVFFNMILFLDRFWSQLGSILVPKWAQNRSQKRSTKRSKF